MRLPAAVSPVIVLFALAPAYAAEATVFHVAPNGDDAWSGRLGAPAPDGRDGPFATVRRARDAVRQLKAQNGGGLPTAVTVRLRGGTYRLAEPLVLTPD